MTKFMEILTPEQRSLRASLAAHTMHGEGKTNTAPATEAFLRRFEVQADPDGLLAPEERRRRAVHLRKAYMLDLALRSSRARAERAQSES